MLRATWSSREMQRGGGRGRGLGLAENASSFLGAFCDSRKTREKIAQPSHPYPAYTADNFFFLSFPSSRLACLALARAPNPV